MDEAQTEPVNAVLIATASATSAGKGAIPCPGAVRLSDTDHRPGIGKESGIKGPDSPPKSPSAPMPPLDNPSGKTMLDRANKVGDMVFKVLKSYPQSRGDHMLVWLGVLRRFYWKLVKIETRPTLSITWITFDAFFKVPSFETCRRRCQEIQHDEKERIWNEVAVICPDIVMQYEGGNEWREDERALKEFLVLAKKSDLLPRGRTIRKRMRNESVHEKYFTDRQLDLDDFYGD